MLMVGNAVFSSPPCPTGWSTSARTTTMCTPSRCPRADNQAGRPGPRPSLQNWCDLGDCSARSIKPATRAGPAIRRSVDHDWCLVSVVALRNRLRASHPMRYPPLWARDRRSRLAPMPAREWHICAAGAEPGQNRRPASDGDRDSGVERRRRTRPDHPAAWAVGRTTRRSPSPSATCLGGPAG